MNFRTITLALLFVSLAGTVLGTLLSLFAQAEFGWRLTGTMFLLTVMSGVWAGATRAGEARATPAVLTIVIGSGVTAALITLAIWEIVRGRELELIVTAVSCGGATIAASGTLRMLAFPQARDAAWVAFGLEMVAATLWIATAWSGMADDGFRGWILMASAPIAFMNLFGDHRRGRGAAWTCTGLCALAVGVVILLSVADDLMRTWQLQHHELKALYRLCAIVAVLGALALAIGMGRVARMARSGREARWVHIASIGLVLLQGAVVALWCLDVRRGDHMERLLVAIPIMIVAGAIVSVVLDRIASHSLVLTLLDLKDVRLECPRCKSRMRVSAHGTPSTCSKCSLGIRVDITQQRCFACQYDLTGSPTATSCPECGGPVSPACTAACVTAPPCAAAPDVVA